MDILVWIFHVSTSNLSCHLYTSAGDIYIPHFYVDFFYVLKNFINRIDTLILNIHISTCKSSCYLFTCDVYLRVLSTILHGIFPIQWRIFNRRLDIQMYIFQVSTSNLSCYTFSDSSCLPYIPQLHMEFFYKLKIFTRRIDILVWIFHVTTENLSGLLYTSGSDKYIPHFYMKIFYMLIYSAGARYPGKGFPYFYFQLIIFYLQQ